MIINKQQIINKINELLLYTGRVFILVFKEDNELLAWGEKTNLDNYINHYNLDLDQLYYLELSSKKASEIYKIVCCGDYKNFL